jgi:hypothetical protein
LIDDYKFTFVIQGVFRTFACVLEHFGGGMHFQSEGRRSAGKGLRPGLNRGLIESAGQHRAKEEVNI